MAPLDAHAGRSTGRSGYKWIPPVHPQAGKISVSSVWNSEWKIIIPAYSLLADEQEGLDRFVRSVEDIKIFLRTYSHSGN